MKKLEFTLKFLIKSVVDILPQTRIA